MSIHRHLAYAIGAVVATMNAGGQSLTHASPSVQDAQRGFLESAIVLRVVQGVSLDGQGRPTLSGVAGTEPEAAALADAFTASGVIRVQPLVSDDLKDRALAADLGLDRMYLVILSESAASSVLLCESLATLSGLVEHAQPVRTGGTLDVADIPSDPAFSLQYALHNTGQSVEGVAGLQGADINALHAWSVTNGSAHVPIAILDAGISYAHPDLFFKIIDAHNTTGSGPVHDANDPFNSHGTHVAGIAAAASNNAIGMTGMSWSSPLLAVKVANALGFTSDVWLGQGLMWAADHEARVAVVSIGLDSGSDFLHSAVKYAEARGVVICASTGNTGQPGVKYPAKYPETIAIGATDNRDVIAEFSTTGPEVTVVAPGVEILSTWDDFTGPPTYVPQSGTSASCPLVAGIVSLMLAEDPSLNTARVVELLRLSVIDFGPIGFDPQYGWGRIDAYRAVTAAQGTRACAADVNQNGAVEPTDLSAWVGAFERKNPVADQNFDGAVTPQDFGAFISNYLLGCE